MNVNTSINTIYYRTRVVAAAKAEGKFTISYTDRVAAIEDVYALGVDSVTFSSDASILSESLTNIIEQIKG